MRATMIGVATLLCVPLTAWAQSSVPVEKPPSDTGGVIHPPPHVDPGINAPRPAIGGHSVDPMPVVPPAGTPGGKPDVVPK